MYLLDTDICSYLMKRRYPTLVQKVQAFAPKQLKVSVISVYELEYGLEKSGRRADLLRVVKAFLENVEILDLNRSAARHAAVIRAALAAQGKMIGAQDLLIAGHARALDATLITHNLREFSRVPELRCESWV